VLSEPGERQFGKVAVRIEKREAFAGHEVLADEIEKRGAFAGAGLADDIEVPAASLGIEHDGFARDPGTDAKLLMMWQCHGRKGAGVPCAPQFGSWCWQRPPSVRTRRGYMASLSLCVVTGLPNPPLTAGSFPTTIFSRPWSS
jgi:hypothetical protein